MFSHDVSQRSGPVPSQHRRAVRLVMWHIPRGLHPGGKGEVLPVSAPQVRAARKEGVDAERSAEGEAAGQQNCWTARGSAPAQSMLGSSPSPAPDQGPQRTAFPAILSHKQKRANATSLSTHTHVHTPSGKCCHRR